MAIVQRIITDHGGKISVTSEEGVGTLIRLEFANPNAVVDQMSE